MVWSILSFYINLIHLYKKCFDLSCNFQYVLQFLLKKQYSLTPITFSTILSKFPSRALLLIEIFLLKSYQRQHKLTLIIHLAVGSTFIKIMNGSNNAVFSNMSNTFWSRGNTVLPLLSLEGWYTNFRQ